MDIIYRYDPHAPIVVDFPKSAQDALFRLEAGNLRFAQLVDRLQEETLEQGEHEEVVIPINPLTLGVPFTKGMTMSQSPYAIVLGCSDARVPIEHIFDCGANELFVVRIAGNVLGLECLGSIDYAIAHLADSLKTGLVLGHTGCGAVTAAVDLYLSPNQFVNIAFSHPVRSLVDRIMLAVRGAARALDQRFNSPDHSTSHYRQLLITTSTFLSAALTAYDLQREIKSMTSSPVATAFGVYDVACARVSALPIQKDQNSSPVFLPAPESANEVIEVATQIVERLL